jgi:hypothetical protein
MEKQNEKNAMKTAMKGLSSLLFTMIADFALLAGIVLILFGVGELISSFLGIPGIGKIGLGIILFVIAVIMLSRSRTRVQIGVQPPMPPGAMVPPKPPEPPSSGSYR